MNTEFLAQRLQCSRTDKQECLQSVHQLLEIAFFAREKGLVALDKFFQAEKARFSDPFLQKSVSCLVDIANPSLLRQVLYNYIIAGNYSGPQFLRNIVIAETMMAIHQHVDVDKIFSFLVPSYFGLEFENNVIEIYKQYVKNHGYRLSNDDSDPPAPLS